jgi:hypothetical protein
VSSSLRDGKQGARALHPKAGGVSENFPPNGKASSKIRKTPADVINAHPKASVVMTRFFGSHEECDQIDAETV